MKKCPFCAEEIQDEAIKCKHCDSMLSTKQEVQEEESKPIPEKLKKLAGKYLKPEEKLITFYKGFQIGESLLFTNERLIILYAMWMMHECRMAVDYNDIKDIEYYSGFSVNGFKFTFKRDMHQKIGFEKTTISPVIKSLEKFLPGVNIQGKEKALLEESKSVKKAEKVSEIRYTCNSCGNIWHKLPSSESNGAQECTRNLACLSCVTAPCCFPLYASLCASTQEDKICPKCHSQNIKREVLEYDKRG